jgi:hypothetical protein
MREKGKPNQYFIISVAQAGPGGTFNTILILLPVAEFFIIGEKFVVITSQLQAAVSKLSTMKDKSCFVKVPVVITKQ